MEIPLANARGASEDYASTPHTAYCSRAPLARRRQVAGPLTARRTRLPSHASTPSLARGFCPHAASIYRSKLWTLETAAVAWRVWGVCGRGCGCRFRRPRRIGGNSLRWRAARLRRRPCPSPRLGVPQSSGDLLSAWMALRCFGDRRLCAHSPTGERAHGRCTDRGTRSKKLTLDSSPFDSTRMSTCGGWATRHRALTLRKGQGRRRSTASRSGPAATAGAPPARTRWHRRRRLGRSRRMAPPTPRAGRGRRCAT